MANSLFRRKEIKSILAEGSEEGHGTGLKRVLTVRDLTFFGIAAIIGAGSFSSLGEAVFKGGPGVVVLFIITGIACAFTAFCYSEFCQSYPCCRQCLYLLLCELWRTVCVDNWVGPDHGIFDREYLCCL